MSVLECGFLGAQGGPVDPLVFMDTSSNQTVTGVKTFTTLPSATQPYTGNTFTPLKIAQVLKTEETIVIGTGYTIPDGITQDFSTFTIPFTGVVVYTAQIILSTNTSYTKLALRDIGGGFAASTQVGFSSGGALGEKAYTYCGVINVTDITDQYKFQLTPKSTDGLDIEVIGSSVCQFIRMNY